MKYVRRATKYLLPIFLIPLTISGITANYSYSIISLTHSIKRDKLYNPIIFLYGTFIIYSYGVGLFFVVPHDGYSLVSQFLGLGTSLIVFSLLLVQLEFSEKDLFFATTFCGLGYTVIVLYYIATDPSLTAYNPLAVKEGLRHYINDWPQRYVIIMMCGFFYSFHSIYYYKKYIIPTAVIGCGILFTFTRAAYIAVLVGILFYITNVTLGYYLYYGSIKKCRNGYILYTSIILFIFLVYVIYFTGFSEVALMFWERIYNPISSILFEGEVEGSSTRVRLKYWHYSYEVFKQNIVSGTGAAGVHLFKDTGSTHNQFLDVMVRHGLVGAFFYIWFYIIIIRNYIIRDTYIASLVVAWAVYGVFHETTALSYGSFVFYALLSKTLDKKQSQ